MFRNRNVVCAVELGTSKICALIGEIAPDGTPTVIGRGLARSDGAVIKGEISDMEKCCTILGKVLDEADRASGGELENCRLVTVLATGCAIDSCQGCGIVTIKNPLRIVTEAERAEAAENAKIIDLAADREMINTSDAYYTVDKRRVRNPLRQSGSRLEAIVHIVHALSSRIENFRRALRESGIENAVIEPVFTSLADGIAVAGAMERENGSLLIDLGAGTTEYLVNFDGGIRASGVLQLGMEHVANDLSLGLDLHIDRCRKLLAHGELERASAEKREFLEIAAANGRQRKVPVAGCERIVEARLREIFELIRRRLVEKEIPLSLGGGGILTGGGAEYYRTRDIFTDVFDLSCRIACPVDAGGAVTDLESPRFSAVWGALKCAAFFSQLSAGEEEGMFQKLVDKFNHVWDRRGEK